MFLVLVIGLHLLDVLTRFQSASQGMNYTMLVAYMLMALLAAPALIDQEGFLRAYASGRVGLYALISAVAYFLPWALGNLGFVTTFINQNFWANLLIILTPPWFIFLIFSPVDEKIVNIMRRAWLLFWITVLIITLLSMATGNILELQGGDSGNLQLDPAGTFADLWDRISQSLSDFWKGLIGAPEKVGRFVNRNLNDTLGQSYRGQVDPYTDKELGVRFTDIRTFASRFREGDDVVVWADLQGKSFKENIELVLRCYAKGRNGRVINGTVETQGGDDNKVLISMQERISASCTLKDMPKGYYDVHFVGAFAFKTWA